MFKIGDNVIVKWDEEPNTYGKKAEIISITEDGGEIEVEFFDDNGTRMYYPCDLVLVSDDGLKIKSELVNDDWERIYINDECVYEGHNVTARQLMEELERYGVKTEYTEVCEDI